MSADNYIAIQKRKNKWFVWMDFASYPKNKPDGYYKNSFNTQEEAMAYALGLSIGEVIEYGIQLLPTYKPRKVKK